MLAVSDTMIYIRANIGDRTMTPQTLADRVHYSVTWLSVVMREMTGASITRTIARIRLDEAARRLRDTHDQVKDISQAVGYATPAGLSTAFERVYGCYPKVYRQRHRQRQWAERQAIYEAGLTSRVT